jgi:hypothetical protein
MLSTSLVSSVTIDQYDAGSEGCFQVAILLSGHCTDAVKAARSGKHIQIDDPQRAWTNLKLECCPQPSYIVKVIRFPD